MFIGNLNQDIPEDDYEEDSQHTDSESESESNEIKENDDIDHDPDNNSSINSVIKSNKDQLTTILENMCASLNIEVNCMKKQIQKDTQKTFENDYNQLKEEIKCLKNTNFNCTESEKKWQEKAQELDENNQYLKKRTSALTDEINKLYQKKCEIKR